MNATCKLLLFSFVVMSISSFAQTIKPIDYLGVDKPIVFNKEAYNLAWTSHPNNFYYKQEYLSKGDTLKKFKRLILLEIFTSKVKLTDVVTTKIVELKKLKASNPIVNFETFQKNGEIILDFLLSEDTPDGKYLSIIERNVYRYKEVVDKNGNKGILLFGVSERAYGDDIETFLPALKKNRYDLINAIGSFEIPEIVIAK